MGTEMIPRRAEVASGSRGAGTTPGRGSEKARPAHLLARLRVLALMVVAVLAPSYPDVALREGALLSGLVLLSALANIRLRAADTMAILLGVLAWASQVWAIDAAASELGYTNVAACVVIYVCVRTVAVRRSDVRLLATGVVVGGLLAVIRVYRDNPGTRLRLEYDSQAARVGIEGLNYNALAYGLATAAAMLVLVWATSHTASRRRAATLLLVATMIALYVGVILSGTRGALLAIGFLLVWLMFARLSPAKLFRILVTVAVLSHISVFLGLSDRLLLSAIGRTVRETGDLNGRLSIWPVARDAVWTRPFNGYGVDGMVALPGNLLGIAAHNVSLDIAVGLGLPGLVLLVGIAVASFREALAGAATLDFVIAGAYLAVLTPITLTGYWVESPLLWLTLGILSRLQARPASNDPAGPTPT